MSKPIALEDTVYAMVGLRPCNQSVRLTTGLSFAILLFVGLPPIRGQTRPDTSALSVRLTSSPPDPDWPIRADACGLRPDERARLADLLARVTPALGTRARTHCLALARFLSPQNLNVRTIESQLLRGEYLRPADGELPTDEVARVLIAKGKALLEKPDPAERTLGNYLAETAVLVEPSDATVAYYYNRLPRDSSLPRWPAELAEAGESSDAPRRPIVKGIDVQYAGRVRRAMAGESQVACLVVAVMGGQHIAGGVHTVKARVDDTDPHTHAQVLIAGEIGPQMRASLGTAFNVLRSRYPHLPSGKLLILRVEDQESPMDGPSASAGFALLLLSLFDGFAIDSAVAITGVIQPDWSIGPVSGLGLKVGAALRGDYRIVIVPSGNGEALTDLVGDGSVVSSEDIQVIGVASLEDAAALARADRSPAHAGALAKFDEAVALRRRYKERKDPELLSKADTALREVLAVLPGHQSAAFLLQHPHGAPLVQLSLERSVDRFTAEVLPGLTLGTQLLKDRTPSADRAQRIQRSLDASARLRPLLHPQLLDLTTSVDAFLGDCHRVDSGSVAAPGYDRLRFGLDRVREALNRIPGANEAGASLAD